MPKIKINKILCNLPDEIDMDEIYLKYQGKKIWPKEWYFRVDTGDEAPVDLVMDLEEGWQEIELWDFDYTSKNDFLGTFQFKVDGTPGMYSTSMHLVEKNSTASYIMFWEILPLK